MIRRTVMPCIVAGLAVAAFAVLAVAGVAQASTTHPQGVSWASPANISPLGSICC